MKYSIKINNNDEADDLIKSYENSNLDFNDHQEIFQGILMDLACVDVNKSIHNNFGKFIKLIKDSAENNSMKVDKLLQDLKEIFFNYAKK